jgi:VCBS repeat-containing protein
VLSNDTDADGDPLTALLVTAPTHGTLNLNSDGSFTYVPATNYSGADFFTYRASDGALNSGVATVTLTITAVNDAPVGVADSYTANEDVTLTVAAPGVLGNDSDPEGSALTAALVVGPTHGTLTLNANGSFTYRPATNYNGPDSFTYRASDGSLNSAITTVTLTVNAVNDAPVATGDSYSAVENTPLVVAAAGVLSNDTDADGDTLSAVLVSNPAHGTLTLNANGSFTYVPVTNYNGADSFTYRATDGVLNSALATVSISIIGVNDAPIAANDSYSIAEDTTLSVTAPGVLRNDTDADGNTL